jgi:hypothetical protein
MAMIVLPMSVMDPAMIMGAEVMLHVSFCPNVIETIPDMHTMIIDVTELVMFQNRYQAQAMSCISDCFLAKFAHFVRSMCTDFRAKFRSLHSASVGNRSERVVCIV